MCQRRRRAWRIRAASQGEVVRGWAFQDRCEHRSGARRSREGERQGTEALEKEEERASERQEPWPGVKGDSALCPHEVPGAA